MQIGELISDKLNDGRFMDEEMMPQVMKQFDTEKVFNEVRNRNDTEMEMWAQYALGLANGDNPSCVEKSQKILKVTDEIKEEIYKQGRSIEPEDLKTKVLENIKLEAAVRYSLSHKDRKSEYVKFDYNKSIEQLKRNYGEEVVDNMIKMITAERDNEMER